MGKKKKIRRNPQGAIPWWGPAAAGFGLIVLGLATPIPDDVAAIPLGLAMITGSLGYKAVAG